jgi:hypothetical protein
VGTAGARRNKEAKPAMEVSAGGGVSSEEARAEAWRDRARNYPGLLLSEDTDMKARGSAIMDIVFYVSVAIFPAFDLIAAAFPRGPRKAGCEALRCRALDLHAAPPGLS